MRLRKYLSTIFGDPRKRLFVFLGILFLSTVCLYASVFNNPFVWDDFYVIVKNKHVHELQNFLTFFSENTYQGSGSIGVNWRPLMLTTFSSLWHFFGGWTVPYHAASIFLHALNAFLVYVLLNRLFRKHWAAFLAALVFAIHPLQTQAVVYIAGLGDPLGGGFVLLGAISYAKWRDGNERTKAYLLGSILCFMCALLSKENAVMMPGLIFLIDIFLKKGGDPFWKKMWVTVQDLTPFIYLFLAYIIARLTFLNFLPNVYTSSFSVPLYERILVFLSTVTDYFRLIFAPLHLHMEHTVYMVNSLFEPKAFIGFLIMSVLLTAIVTQWKKRPAVSFGFLWFLVAYSPNMNIFMPTTNLFGEHWLYLSLPGLFLAIFSVGEEIAQKNRRFLTILLLVLIIWAGWISGVTVVRNLDWETPIGILEQTHREEPKHVQVMIVLASLYRDNGEYDKALEHYANALALESYNYLAYSERAELYKKIGDEARMISDMENSCQFDSVHSPSLEPLLEIYTQKRELDKAESLLFSRLNALGDKDPVLSFWVTTQLVLVAVGKQDHKLIQEYLTLGGTYEKQINEQWFYKADRYMAR